MAGEWNSFLGGQLRCCNRVPSGLTGVEDEALAMALVDWIADFPWFPFSCPFFSPLHVCYSMSVNMARALAAVMEHQAGRPVNSKPRRLRYMPWAVFW